MIDPYRMVIINIVTFSLLTISLFFYKYVYPKKKINAIVFIFLISFLPIISVFRKGSYESGDLTIHIKIGMAFFESLKQGFILPSWINFENNGYGGPVFLFHYLLPYYLISFFHMLGFSFIASTKMIIIFSYISSGLFMFLWVKTEFNKRSAIIASIFYLYTPYHLIDMHFRNAIAELIAFSLIPLIFLLIKKCFLSGKFIFFALNVIFVFCLIICHQVISLAVFPFFILYIIFLYFQDKKKNAKNLLYLAISFVWSLLLSSFYWLPILIEKKYIYWGISPNVALPKFTEFLYSPWRFGLLFQGHYGELSYLIGYTQVLVIFIAVLMLIKKLYVHKEKKYILFFLVSFLIILFIMQSSSKFLWETIPLIKSFQFSYRLLLLESFFISIIAGITLNKLKNKKVIFIICLLTIAVTILNWGNRKTLPEINDQKIKKQLFEEKFAFGLLTTPKWLDIKQKYPPIRSKSRFEIFKGNGEIVKITEKINEYEYLIHAKTSITVRGNITYYPGWMLTINNNRYKVNYQNQDFPGIITFDLDKGLYRAKLKLEDTNVRRTGKIISLIGIIIFACSVIFWFPKKYIRS